MHEPMPQSPSRKSQRKESFHGAPATNQVDGRAITTTVAGHRCMASWSGTNSRVNVVVLRALYWHIDNSTPVSPMGEESGKAPRMKAQLKDPATFLEPSRVTIAAPYHSNDIMCTYKKLMNVPVTPGPSESLLPVPLLPVSTVSTFEKLATALVVEFSKHNASLQQLHSQNRVGLVLL